MEYGERFYGCQRSVFAVFFVVLSSVAVVCIWSDGLLGHYGFKHHPPMYMSRVERKTSVSQMVVFPQT